MFHRIYNNLVAPKLAFAASSAAAAKLGLKTFRIAGSNMAPTLEPKTFAWYRPEVETCNFTRTSVVAYWPDERKEVLIPSRIAGVAGDTLELRNGVLWINSAPVLERYVAPQRAEQEFSLSHAPVTVPEGHVWLLGDFRDMSKDSRHVGPFPYSALAGRITHVHAPGMHASARTIAEA